MLSRLVTIHQFVFQRNSIRSLPHVDERPFQDWVSKLELNMLFMWTCTRRRTKLPCWCTRVLFFRSEFCVLLDSAHGTRVSMMPMYLVYEGRAE